MPSRACICLAFFMRDTAMQFELRPATSADLPQIMAIFNQEILHGTANWSEDPRSPEQMQHWFEQLQQHGFPLIVAGVVDSDRVAGYANYDFFSYIQGYRQTVEHSVFIDPAYARQGLGKKLMLELIGIAKTKNMHIMVAAIDAENQASIRLHEGLGFVQTGFMPQLGKKFGQWRDLALLQLDLDATN